MSFLKGFFDGSAAKKAPETAPEAVEPESRRDLPVKPELSVVESRTKGQETPVKTVEATSPSSIWKQKAAISTDKATKLFDKANTYFREQKESKGNGKWADGTPQKEAWKLSCSQIPRCELLSKHAKALEDAKAEWTEILSRPLPMAPIGEEEVSLASSGKPLAERTAQLEAYATRQRAYEAWHQDLERMKEVVRFEKACISDLEEAYNETELKIAGFEVEMDGLMSGKEKNLFVLAQAAYDRLVKAEDNLRKIKGNLLKRIWGFLKIDVNKDSAVFNAEKELKDADSAVKAIEERIDESGLRSYEQK